jgi:hypothetical protein
VNEVIACLTHLVTPEGIEALHQCAATAEETERGKACKEAVADLLEPLGLTYEAYAAKTPQEKAKTAASLRNRTEDKYRLRPDDRKLTHDEFLKAAADWIASHRISGGNYEWIEDRHVMAAATAADIPLLLDVEAACYTRLSDERLDEIGTLQQLVQRLGRTRYRRDAGLCEKCEAPQPFPIGKPH